MRVSHHHRSRRPIAGPSRHRGATILETALVLPIFFTFILGFIDIGMGVLQTSQASSGAADGARRGIVSLGSGEDLTTADRDAIRAEVRARLAGQGVDTISIECVNDTGTVAACGAAKFIRVQVSWQFRPVSFVGAALPVQSITGTAKMAIVRQPAPASTTTTAPTP